jgi:NAD(P)H-dependent FMN reductase
LNLPVIVGSVRANRRSLQPAELIVSRVRAAGHQSDLVDLRTLDLPLHGTDVATDDHPAIVAFRARMDAADAVVIVSPEYNHSITAPLKSALDHLKPELRRKPALACGLSEIGRAHV